MRYELTPEHKRECDLRGRGRIRDLCPYRRALADDEIRRPAS